MTAVDLAAATAHDGDKPAPLPLPEMIVRGSHVRLDRVQPGPAQIVPVLSVRSEHVEIQLALQDATIDQLIEALQDVRRARSGLTVAKGVDLLPGSKRHHP